MGKIKPTWVSGIVTDTPTDTSTSVLGGIVMLSGNAKNSA